MKKRLLSILIVALLATLAFSLVACNGGGSTTLEKLESEYGVVVDGGSFEEGSSLISNEIVATTEEATEVLTAIAEQDYNKEGSVYIFDIYVAKDGAKVQPTGKVKVSIPVPNTQVDKYLVFHVKDDNSVEKLVPTVEDGIISFETSSFSYFVIAEEAPDVPECTEHSYGTDGKCTACGAECVHTEVIDAAVAATCTQPGMTEGKHCSVCNTVIVAQEEVPALDHSYVWVEGSEPTCEAEGVIAHYHCDRCGKNFNPNYGEIETVAIPKAEHGYGSMYWEKSPSFWEDGNIAYYQCETCKKYFDGEYNEVETVVIPKNSTNLSICVNGMPTVLTLDEQNENSIIWSLTGLSVAKGDVITICQTDNAAISYNYFAEGNVGKDGKILTTAAAANVVLTATPNGLMLFIDGYKYEGVVIEINGVQYPMNYVTYSDEQTTGYIYGLVNFAEDDKFVVVDNVSGTVYDYDDLSATYKWNTWDFHRGDNGEFVIDNAGRYGIEFDGDITKKIYINKHFAPLDGSSYEVVIEGNQQGVSMQQTKIPEGSEAYDGVVWYYKHDSMMNVDDILAYIEENGLYTYTASVTLAAGSKLNIKNLSVNTVITADHLTEVYANDVCLTKEGDYVKFLSGGVYFITYLPAYNAFGIHKTEEELPDAYIYCDVGFVALQMDANSTVSYEGLVAEANDYVMFLDGTKTKYLSITLDSNTDSTIAHVITSEGLDMLFFDKAGTYNLAYNLVTGVLSITSVGGSDDNPTVDYMYSLIMTNGASSNQTISMQTNPNNSKEVYCQGVSIEASYFISVMEIAKDGSSSNTYGAIADTDASIAQSYGTIAMVKVAGTYDIYFDTEAKTIKLVPVAGNSCGDGECKYDEGVVTKEPTHFEEGVKTYTCTVCGREKEETIGKTDEHMFTEWYPSAEIEDKHERICKCGKVETGECSFDNGVVTKEPTHFEEGVKTYTCTVCGREKEVSIGKTEGHMFTEWYPSEEVEDEHERICKCGKVETGECSFDNGVVTKEPTHFEEGVKTYTCTVCGREKEVSIEKIGGHSFGEWKPDELDETKHYKQCACGEVETGNCTFDNGVCTVCGREKIEKVEGIIIVIVGGTATFEGKDTVTSDSNIYGENATVYIAQKNDVLNVTLNDQEGRTFKRWESATGTIIPDEDFSILVFISGYYYPVFEDTDDSEFTNRVKIYEGNCEEGILYKSTNSKGDVKYELEFENYGRHYFDEYVPHNNQYHKLVCLICGEPIFEEHTDYRREVEKEATHTEEGLMRCECFCGHVWTEPIPTTEEHSIDYDDWHIVEESKNGQYGKYRVYCKSCDYYEEYWYLGGLDFVSFMDGRMIQYQYTYGGKVSHDEYYYSYRNAEGKKVYIWALQYEYENSSNKDKNDTYIFMYVDDENSATIEPIYLSKSRGNTRSEYLWAIYAYAYDVNGWIETLDYPDDNMGCNNGMVLGNSMSARASVFEAYHDYWAETYNDLRIPTSRAYDDFSDTPWEVDYEGKFFEGGYYDENDEYVTTGGRDSICYVKNAGTSYKKEMYVDKATGITFGYADYGTYSRTIFMMRTYKAIVSPEEFEKLDAAAKSLHYSYGDIEKDVKSLCAKRIVFNNFTLTIPETIGSFRFIFSDPVDCVELSGDDTNVYDNTSHVYDSGSPITLTWQDEEGIAFDRYEIWDFVNQKWVMLSDSPVYTFNTLENPRRDAAYVRVICHEIEVPVEPSEIFRITVENGYFEIDGKEYTGTVEVPGGTLVYVWANEVAGKTFDYWVMDNGEEFDDYKFNVTSDVILTPVYTDAIYRVYCEGWNYDAYVSINDGEMHYSNEFEGKAGDTFELNTTYEPEYGCTVFIGWYMEVYGYNGSEYILISDKQAFTYTITGEEYDYGYLYAVWTTGENPFIKKYVDIRVTNGFVQSAGGEGEDMSSGVRDNAYSAISLSTSGRVMFYDDPTDEIEYENWDVAYRYELEGELQHTVAESYEDEYDYRPADYWVEDPEYSYPDGEINVTGIKDETGSDDAGSDDGSDDTGSDDGSDGDEIIEVVPPQVNE